MVSVALPKHTDIQTSDKPPRLRAWAKHNKMRKYTQNIEECEHCGKVFENGENYWKDAHNKCYCVDNACGWEDDDTSDGNCTTIHGVSDSTLDELIQCADCDHRHTKGERIRKSDGTWETYHCPKCDSESYYTL